MMADNDNETGGHQDFQGKQTLWLGNSELLSTISLLIGDISEQFNPIIGENSETSSLAGVSPGAVMREEVGREPVNIIMADSDDSL